MKEQTATSGRRGSPASKRVMLLLLCGAVSSVLYVATDVLAALSWPAYSYTSQSVSQLLAIGTPTRAFVFPLMAAYNVLMVAFGARVWASAGRSRAMRVTGVLLVLYGIVSHMGLAMYPLHLGETEASSGVGGHIAVTAALVLLMFSFMVGGAVARGRAFRVYSFLTIVAILGGSVLTGMQVEALQTVGSSPWLGVLERIGIYATMLWVAVFAVALLRSGREHAPRTGGATAGEAGRAKKVTAFVGSAHREGATYTAARKFLDGLESFGDVNGEIVVLSDYDLGVCRGCKVCFERGEDRCPLKDDRDVLIAKIAESDGIVLASPNYSFQVSAGMKIFLDRLGFLFHRPRFHGKTATAIVVQGIGMGGKIRKYLEFVEGGLGFTVVKGTVSKTLLPMTDEALRKMDEALAAQSRRFHDRLLRSAPRVPSLLDLMVFRMGRTGIGRSGGEVDRAYWQGRGWFESDYYYPVRLGPFRKAAGAFFDWAGAHVSTFDVADEPEGTPGPGSPTSTVR